MQNLSDDEIKVEGDLIKVKDLGKEIENETKFENVAIKVEEKQISVDGFLDQSEQLNKNEIDVKVVNGEFNSSERQSDDKNNVQNNSTSIASKQLKPSLSSEKLVVQRTNETKVKKENIETNHSKTLTNDEIHVQKGHNQSHLSSSSEKSVNLSYNGVNVKIDEIETKENQSSSSSSSEKSVKVSNKNNEILHDIVIKDKDENSSCAENELTEVSGGY